MSVKTQGAAGTEIDFLDFTFFISSGNAGRIALMGETERGKIGEPQLVDTWEQYQTKFGGYLPNSDFPILVKRFLDIGGKALICPVGHYLDVNDPSTLLGTKASHTQDDTALSETLATATIQVNTLGTSGQDIVVKANQIIIGTYTIQVADTVDDVATGIAAAINTTTGTFGYTASATTDTVTVTAPTGSGDSINNATLVAYTADGSGTYTFTRFTGGVTSANAIDITFQAKEIGQAYNGVWYEIKPSADKTPNEFDIVVGIDGYPSITKTILNVPATMTSDIQNRINNEQFLIEVVDGFSGDIRATSKTYLTGGVFDRTQITPQDYIGSAIGNTGVYAFDSFTNFVKLAVLGVHYPDVDIALAAYAEQRKDFIFATSCPVMDNTQNWLDYRNGEGVYSHAALDTWRGFMTAGGIKHKHPDTLLPEYISELGDVLGLISKKDTETAAWFSAAGSKRGRIKDALGVRYNVGTPARKSVADQLSIQGINTVIDHESYAVVFFDNVTLQRKNTILKNLNVAELLIYLSRTIKPLTDEELFDPNDIDTWKAIYRKVFTVMDFVQTGRGIYRWLYEGDQDIANVTEAVINSSDNISQGAYIFNLYFAPTPALKFIKTRGIVTTAGVDFDELV